jgi:ribosomal peptide maturation radical SAM protein 1
MSASKQRRRRSLLITMPLANPLHPNLAIEQLAATARRAHESCDTLYGTLLIPPTITQSVMNAMLGPAIFTPAYFGMDREDVARRLAEESAPIQYGSTTVTGDAFEALIMDYLIAIDAADVCLARCLAAIPIGSYDIIGFSVGFDAQKLPSAALARYLKQREQEVTVVFGGSGCDGVMGHAILEVFPEVDVVLQGEADNTFLPLLRALRGDEPIEAVPDCLYRSGDGIHGTPTARPPEQLSNTPFPDYDSFLKQRSASAYHRDKQILLFETSRGCWYGQKNHCRFCGIRSVSQGYRRRLPEDAVRQIRELSHRFAPDVLYATDAILDMDYLKTVLPDVARLRHDDNLDFTLFYEIKSTLRRQQIALLAAAGVAQVQPGIESFSTNILGLMHKGATGLQQVELLKWAEAYGIKLLYGLIVGTPGESVQDYEDVERLMPLLHHLPPPLMLNPLALHKFSPYEAAPEQYGIRDIRPYDIQRFIYQAPDNVLMRLCYELDYTLEQQHRPEMMEAVERLRAALQRWRTAYRQGEHLVMRSVEGSISLLRRSVQGGMAISNLRGLEAAVYLQCQHVNTIDAVARHLRESRVAVEEVMQRLAAERLIAMIDGRCLALAVPGDADAWRDSGLANKERVVIEPSLSVIPLTRGDAIHAYAQAPSADCSHDESMYRSVRSLLDEFRPTPAGEADV